MTPRKTSDIPDEPILSSAAVVEEKSKQLRDSDGATTKGEIMSRLSWDAGDGLLHDRIHLDVGGARAAKSVKSRVKP